MSYFFLSSVHKDTCAKLVKVRRGANHPFYFSGIFLIQLPQVFIGLAWSWWVERQLLVDGGYIFIDFLIWKRRKLLRVFEGRSFGNYGTAVKNETRASNKINQNVSVYQFWLRLPKETGNLITTFIIFSSQS